ncbi:glutamine synthetase family protein [Amphritea balenae]|nr:glutamine synthetase family protein [Amphritea balenae]
MLNEINRFREQYPEVREVDLISVDLPGKFFGKRYGISDLEKLAAGKGKMPAAMHLMCSKGFPVPARGYGFNDGDPDAAINLIPGTLKYVGWESQPRAQVMVSFTDVEGQDLFWEPRHVLKRVVKSLQDDGYHPVVAFELEFYLFDLQASNNGNPKPPSGTLSSREDGIAVLSLERLSDYGDLLSEIIQRCEEQGVITGPVSAELGPGQYEINLHHNADVLDAADQCVLFKRIVRGVALKQGVRASFMAKPYLDQSGNGFHFHTSIYDQQGSNLLSQEDDRKLLHMVSGLLELMPASMAFLAPNFNSYRRLKPGNNTPLTPNWGYENRSVAVRIPLSDADNRRIEHRVAGADANPYLAMAVVLAGAHFGLDQQQQPPEPVQEICLEADGVPTDLRAALLLTENSEPLMHYLGEEFVRVFCAQRKGELDAFENAIQSREYDWYL